MSHGCSHPRHKPSALIQKTAARVLTFSRELLLMSEGRGKGERLSLIAAGSRGQCGEPSHSLTQTESPLRLQAAKVCGAFDEKQRAASPNITNHLCVNDRLIFSIFKSCNQFKAMLKIYLWIIIKGSLLSVSSGIL